MNISGGIKIKRYFGFFTFPIFWINRDEAIREIKGGNSVDLKEIIFNESNNDHELLLLRCGLILYRETNLEKISKFLFDYLQFLINTISNFLKNFIVKIVVNLNAISLLGSIYMMDNFHDSIL